MTNQAVFGIVNNRSEAEKMIQTLVDEGIDPHDISILSSHGKEFHEIKMVENEKGAARDWRTEDRIRLPSAKTPAKEKNPFGGENHTKAPEGATTGAAAGGFIGGVLGLLVGLGALAIPGTGPFIVAGPLMSALSGIGAGGTLGGIIGALVGLGLPEFEAKRYLTHLKNGNILLAVRVKNHQEAKHWRDIFKEQGAEDVSISESSSSKTNFQKKDD